MKRNSLHIVYLKFQHSAIQEILALLIVWIKMFLFSEILVMFIIIAMKHFMIDNKFNYFFGNVFTIQNGIDFYEVVWIIVNAIIGFIRLVSPAYRWNTFKFSIPEFLFHFFKQLIYIIIWSCIERDLFKLIKPYGKVHYERSVACIPISNSASCTALFSALA